MKGTRGGRELIRTRRKTTGQEFNESLPLLRRISPDRINAAKKVMLEGKTLQSVADEFGITRQAVNGSVRAVWAAILKYRAQKDEGVIPPGWARVTMVAPKRLILKFREEIATEFKKLGSQ